MKKIYIGFNIILILLILSAIFINKEEVLITKDIETKILKTTKINKYEDNEVQLKKLEEEQEAIEEQPKEEIVVKEEVKEEIKPVENIVENVEILEEQTGSLSMYGPDCIGCSGYLASGYNASGGNYYYHDNTYGDIRIVAGDKSYPLGTIVRIKLPTEEFNAIVLDRGQGIGFGKRFLFDLLCESEQTANTIGTYYNVRFEILRRGY